MCDHRWEFKCKKSGRCILKEAFCDNHYDCKDKSDEPPGCHSTVKHPSKCPKDRFDCKDGTCINEAWMCDGTIDCPSGDDEVNCSKCIYGCCRKVIEECLKPDHVMYTLPRFHIMYAQTLRLAPIF